MSPTTLPSTMARHSVIAEAHEVLNLDAPGSPFEICLGVPVLNGARIVNVYKNAPCSFREIWLNVIQQFATADNDREYIVYYGNTSTASDENAERRSITYGEMKTKVSALANILYDHYSVRKGTRVGIAARNGIDWVAVWWACQVLGGEYFARRPLSSEFLSLLARFLYLQPFPSCSMHSCSDLSSVIALPFPAAKFSFATSNGWNGFSTGFSSTGSGPKSARADLVREACLLQEVDPFEQQSCCQRIRLERSRLCWMNRQS